MTSTTINNPVRVMIFEPYPMDRVGGNLRTLSYILEKIDRRVKISRCVDRLPADQGRVIAMRFAEEKSIREIARELGRSEGAVKQLQFRGLQSLRSWLGGTND